MIIKTVELRFLRTTHAIVYTADGIPMDGVFLAGFHADHYRTRPTYSVEFFDHGHLTKITWPDGRYTTVPTRNVAIERREKLIRSRT